MNKSGLLFGQSVQGYWAMISEVPNVYNNNNN